MEVEDRKWISSSVAEIIRGDSTRRVVTKRRDGGNEDHEKMSMREGTICREFEERNTLIGAKWNKPTNINSATPRRGRADARWPFDTDYLTHPFDAMRRRGSCECLRRCQGKRTRPHTSVDGRIDGWNIVCVSRDIIDSCLNFKYSSFYEILLLHFIFQDRLLGLILSCQLQKLTCGQVLKYI